MLPDIRAVVAAFVAAVALLTIAFGVVATFRVALESRAGSLQADLAQRGHAARPEPQPIVVIETPGPTLLVKAPVEPLPAPMPEGAPASAEPPATAEQAAQPATAPAAPERPSIASLSPDADHQSIVSAASPAPDVPPTIEAVGDESGMATIAATVPQAIETQPEPPSPPAVAAIGGPSPAEIAHAKAQRKLAERARVRKAAAEKRKKVHAARIARERKAAAERAAQANAKQQAAPSSPQGGFDFNPTGAFNSAPFGNSSFNGGGVTNRR